LLLARGRREELLFTQALEETARAAGLEEGERKRRRGSRHR
jgi:hypothetical protein